MNRSERAGGFRIVLRVGTLAFALGLLAVPFLLVAEARAAIELVDFEVASETDRVRIRWETATELNNAGYYVLRSETGGSDPSNYEQITVIDAVSGIPYDFIPARGEDLFGAVYIFYDEAVTVGGHYYYYLQDVDSSNFSSYHGPEDVVVGQTSTPTPTVTPTGSNTSPASTTPSPTASRTPTRTNTPFPGFFPTATPTISPTPTGSPFPTETPTSTETEIPPVDRTLTAIAAALTELPTATATATPTANSAGLTPTRTPRPAATTAPVESPGEDPPVGRILLVVLVFLLSGGLLTAGIVFIARGSGMEEPGIGLIDE
jgi:hypothetical protein